MSLLYSSQWEDQIACENTCDFSALIPALVIKTLLLLLHYYSTLLSFLGTVTGFSFPFFLMCTTTKFVVQPF